MILDEDNTYCAISEVVQLHGAVTHWKQQSLGLTHALNNIPSALLRKKTGFKVKGFLQWELWCWTSHRWCLLGRFQFPTNNLKHHLICNSSSSLNKTVAIIHIVGLGVYSPMYTYRWAPSSSPHPVGRDVRKKTSHPAEHPRQNMSFGTCCVSDTPPGGLPWVWLRWALTWELSLSLPANIKQL